MWVEKHGKSWRIRERVAGEIATIAGGYPTKTAAAAAKRLLDADLLRGDALVPRGGRATLADFAATWWPGYSRGLKPTSADSEGGRLRNHVLPLLGRHALDEIDTLTVQQWVADLEDGVGDFPGRGERRKLAPKSVHNCHGLLFVLMSAAVAARLIRLNPCSATNLPVRRHREMRFLTDAEIGRLLAATPIHWRPLVTLLVATGLRWGEAIGLRCKNLDLLASPLPRLRVVEHLHELGHGELVWTDPKSERSRRTVSFPRETAMGLTPLVVDRLGDDVVFRTPTGLVVRTRNFRRVWLKACKAAGLEGVRVHDLRHSHVAILIAAGIPLSAISRRLGHSSIAVTDALYGHIREEVHDGIAVAVQAAMAHVPTQVAAEVEDELVGEMDWEQGGSSGSGAARTGSEQSGASRRSVVMPVA